MGTSSLFFKGLDVTYTSLVLFCLLTVLLTILYYILIDLQTNHHHRYTKNNSYGCMYTLGACL